MTQQIKVKVQAGEALRFPGICVHCNKPAVERLRLRKRRGRYTREIEVPLCLDCNQEVRRLSADEERWQQLGWLFGGGTLLITLIALIFLLPAWMPLTGRLLLGLLLAASAAVAVVFASRRHGLQYARPEKQAILDAAHLSNFSWRTTTFEFNNHSFSEKFIELNESYLLNNETTTT